MFIRYPVATAAPSSGVDLSLAPGLGLDLGLGIPILCGLVAWFVIRRRKQREREESQDSNPPMSEASKQPSVVSSNSVGANPVEG
jgi:hypothetical protein